MAEALQSILLADNAYSVASSAHRRAIMAGQRAEAAGALTDEAHSLLACSLNAAAREIIDAEPYVHRLRDAGRGIGLVYVEDGDRQTAAEVHALVAPLVERVLVASGRIIDAARQAEAACTVTVSPAQDAHVPLLAPPANDASDDPMSTPIAELGLSWLALRRRPGGRVEVELGSARRRSISWAQGGADGARPTLESVITGAAGAWVEQYGYAGRDDHASTNLPA